MNEQDRKDFLKRMGYSGTVTKKDEGQRRKVVDYPKYKKKKGINFTNDPAKKKEPAQIEDMGTVRKLYSLFRAGEFHEEDESEIQT